MASRAAEYLSKIPFITCSLIVLNCTVHVVLFFFVTGINQFAINADQVLSGEYYRIITSAFVHGGIMHIFMNMSSLLALGGDLETKFGSLKFAFFTVWSILICGTLYVFLNW
jgi:rhomboid protease GluP